MSKKDKKNEEVKQGLMPSYEATRERILNSIGSVDSHRVNKAGLLSECNDFISCCDCYRFHGNGIPPCAQKKEKKI